MVTSPSESDIYCVVLAKGLFSETNANGLARLWAGGLAVCPASPQLPSKSPSSSALQVDLAGGRGRLAEESKEGGVGGEGIYSPSPSALAEGRTLPAAPSPRALSAPPHSCFTLQASGYRLPVAAVTDSANGVTSQRRSVISQFGRSEVQNQLQAAGGSGGELVSLPHPASWGCLPSLAPGLFHQLRSVSAPLQITSSLFDLDPPASLL